MDVAIGEIAQLILRSGRDRIPRLPDKRKLKTLRRFGLLVYPDGYSLTADAMDRMSRWWAETAADARRWNSPPERIAELEELAAAAREFADKHQVTSAVRGQRFRDLPFDVYRSLWLVVVGGEGKETTEVIPKTHLEMLLRKGYVEPHHHFPSVVSMTDKGRDLVVEFGNPFPGLGPSPARVAARYLDG